MLGYEEARAKGRQCCIDMLGRDFVKKYANLSCSAHGRDGNVVYCFLGLTTEPDDFSRDMILSSDNQLPYRASCSVSMTTGEIFDKRLIVPVESEVTTIGRGNY